LLLEALIEACRKLLMEEFGARRVIPFGSLVEGYWHERSDLDRLKEELRGFFEQNR
jgi:predicted nucleotidyltransferase